MTKPKHPLDSPSVRRKLESATRKFIGNTKWESYLYGMTSQDTWDDILAMLGMKLHSEFTSVFDENGIHPDGKTCEVFKKVELEIFGKCVEDEL